SVEVGNELAFVAALVLNGNTILVRTEVVHDELPASAHVLVHERHFAVERGRLTVKHAQCLRVLQVRNAVKRIVILNVIDGTEASRAARAGRDHVDERFNPLIAVTVAVSSVPTRPLVADVLEPNTATVHANHVISNDTVEAVFPELVRFLERGKPPVS